MYDRHNGMRAVLRGSSLGVPLENPVLGGDIFLSRKNYKLQNY